MTTIKPIKMTDASEEIADTLDAVKSKLGMVPNLIATFAHSKPVLDSYLQFSENLSRGLLTAKQREMIALTVAQVNLCQYCLSAHTLLANVAGLNEAEIKHARQGQASEHADQLIVSFAQRVALHRGLLEPDFVETLRLEGFSDALIIEIIANVVVNIMTNYTNNIARTEIDFPLVNLA